MLTGNREDVVLDLDLYLVGLDPGDIGAHDQVAVLAYDVDRRRPGALAAVDQFVEHPIEPAAQLAEFGKELPAHQAFQASLTSFLVHR